MYRRNHSMGISKNWLVTSIIIISMQIGGKFDNSSLSFYYIITVNETVLSLSHSHVHSLSDSSIVYRGPPPASLSPPVRVWGLPASPSLSWCLCQAHPSPQAPWLPYALLPSPAVLLWGTHHPRGVCQVSQLSFSVYLCLCNLYHGFSHHFRF